MITEAKWWTIHQARLNVPNHGPDPRSQSLLSVTVWDYCMDAPDWIPRGSHHQGSDMAHNFKMRD